MRKITLTLITFCFIYQFISAQVIVPTDFINIQEAIDNSVDGDTIMVLPGAYTGIGNVEIDFNGKEIYLISTKGADSTILDCDSLARAFYFHTNETINSVVDGFTIKHGKKNGENGGGIYCSWSNPRIINCIIDSCYAERGGGIYLSNSSPVITNCKITNNSATWGGAIGFYYSSALIENSDFLKNEAEYYGALGINNYSDPIIKNCIFEENIAHMSGIINVYYNSDPKIQNSKIINNSGEGMSITNYSNVELINCLIADNTGYGIWSSNMGGSITIRNSNIIFNGQYGIYSQSTNYNITNSIIYGNEEEEIYVYNTPIPNISYSCVEGKDGSEIFGNVNWGGKNYDLYPNFIDTLNNDYSLTDSSICINNGDPSTAIGTNEKDLNGNERIYGGNIDIGAYEFGSCKNVQEETLHICENDSVFIGNNWQTEEGIYIDSLINTEGCDSIVITNLVHYPFYQTNVETIICDGDSIFIGNDWQTEPGTYIDSLNTSYGCDSIIYTNFQLSPVSQVNLDTTVCNGDSIFAGNNWQTESGIYVDILNSIHGCDSILVTDVEFINCETNVLSDIKEYLKIYPNPVSNFLIIETKLEKEYTIKIFSISGKLVDVFYIENLSYKKINMYDYKSGMYFIKIENNYDSRTFKIFKK